MVGNRLVEGTLDSTTAAQIARQQETADRRIAIFRQRYGEASFQFAQYAAFPLTLTTDLSYCLREHFTPDLPWYVAADVLLGLCDPVGHDLYEMATATRYLLLARLVEQPEQADLKPITAFLSAYIEHQLKLEGDQNRRAKVLGYPPEWIALAYLQEDAVAAQEIRRQLRELLQASDPQERFRLAALVESQADLLAQRGLAPITLQELAEQLETGASIQTADEWQQRLEEAGFPELKEQQIEFVTVELDQQQTDIDTLQPFEFETVTLNDQGQVVQRRQLSAWQFEEPLNAADLKLEMVAIPSGEFWMGSPDDELGHNSSESPRHLVTVPPFFISKYPITQAQWRSVVDLPQIRRSLDPDPSQFKGSDHPVERVSWHEAQEFCARLSAYTGRDYHLPTEAEWEYACRAGTTTPFAMGETISGEFANYSSQSTYRREANIQSSGQTTPVDRFPPNPFGLHDMHGNVWEWCQDHWHRNYENAPTDGSAWLNPGAAESARVLRGGSWVNPPWPCRSASRSYYVAGFRVNYLGFRVVCSAPRTQ